MLLAMQLWRRLGDLFSPDKCTLLLVLHALKCLGLGAFENLDV
jgi:hypothetical protein